MRRVVTGLVGLAAVAVLAAALAPGAAAAKNRKHVEGTVYDTTCVAICPPCPPPPHCGPIPQPGAKAKVICAGRSQPLIACPLYAGAGTKSPAAGANLPPVCVRAEGCPRFGIYLREGGIVNVRRRGSADVLARLPVVGGSFALWLAPGQYVIHPYLPEESCWSGRVARVKVTARLKSPVPVAVYVSNRCIVHADATR